MGTTISRLCSRTKIGTNVTGSRTTIGPNETTSDDSTGATPSITTAKTTTTTTVTTTIPDIGRACNLIDLSSTLQCPDKHLYDSLDIVFLYRP